MGLLTPLYLLGLTALALPVVFHLLRKSVRKELPFSALIFLRQSPPRLTRRSRIEHWWLLLLRAAILAFLVFAFTRPLFRSQQTVQRSETVGKEILLLVDQSASMQRGELWSEAQAKVRELLDAKRSQDRISLFVFDQTARIVVDATTTAVDASPEDAVRTWSRESRPGWQQDDMAASAQAAIDWYTVGESDAAGVEPDSMRQSEVHIISDFQAPPSGAWNQIEWPDNMRVTLHRLENVSRDNASLTLLQASDDHWDANQLSIRLSNDKNSAASRFTLVDGQENRVGELVLPAGQSRVLSLSPEADPTAAWQLKLIGDLETYDNVLDLPPVASRSVLVAAVGAKGEPLETSSWMLEQACKSLKYQDVQWDNLDSLSGLALDDYQAVFILRPLQAEEVPPVKAFTQQGGLVIVSLVDAIASETRAEWEATLTALSDWQRCSVTEAEVKDFALVASLDTTRPPLQVFRSSSFRDFTSVHFWRYRICEVADTETRTIARFDNGDPFLLHKSVGEGELLVVTAGWVPDESQLGQNSRFATLMIQLAGLRQLRPPLTFAEIGQTIDLRLHDADSLVRLRGPNGRELANSVDANSYRLDAPGLFRLEQDDHVGYVIAQIPSPEREDAQTLPAQLQALGIPGGDDAAVDVAQQRELKLEDEQLEGRQQIWRWLIVGVLVLLVFETLASGWVSRGRSVAQEA